MNEEGFKKLKLLVSEMKPGDKLEYEGSLAIATSVIYAMPEARGGGLDFRIYDNPFKHGHIIERRPADAV